MAGTEPRAASKLYRIIVIENKSIYEHPNSDHTHVKITKHPSLYYHHYLYIHTEVHYILQTRPFG